MATQKINPDTLPKPQGGYAQVIVGTGSKSVFTAGQVALDKDENLVGNGPDGPDYRAQSYQAASNVYAAVAAAGASPADVVRLMVYVVNPTEDNLEQLSAGLREAAVEAGAKATAMTLIGVTALALGAVVEMDATALVD